MQVSRTSIHGHWSGHLAFFLAATGSAVGLGNIWKFPYITGQNGGGAFVLTYLVFIAIIGVPIMMSEIMIGRSGRQSPYNSLLSLAADEGRTPRWAWLGGAGAIAGFLILSYYSVVGGEVMAYIFRTASGMFTNQSSDGVQTIYENFLSRPESLLAWHTIFMVMTMIVVARGVKLGLEKAVLILMPLLIVLLLVLVWYGYNSGGYEQSVDYLFDVDFRKLVYLRDDTGAFIVDAQGNNRLTFDGVLTAMGHAFFTLSLGMGAIMIYGAYLDRRVSIAQAALAVTLADTIIALLAGLAVFPLVFANNLAPDQGPSLIFETLPVAFGAMSYGNFFGAVFFLLLVFAAWTSAISLIEPAVTWLVENRRMTRVQASVWAGLATWILGVVSVFSASGTTIRDILKSLSVLLDLPMVEFRNRFYSLTAFQLIDALVSLVMLPLVGMLIAVFVGWILRRQTSYDELNIRYELGFKIWFITIRYITPVAVFIIFVSGLVGWVRKYLVYQPAF